MPRADSAEAAGAFRNIGYRVLPFRERFEPPTAFRIVGKTEASWRVREGFCSSASA
jgi:hypothetical protein